MDSGIASLISRAYRALPLTMRKTTDRFQNRTGADASVCPSRTMLWCHVGYFLFLKLTDHHFTEPGLQFADLLGDAADALVESVAGLDTLIDQKGCAF